MMGLLYNLSIGFFGAAIGLVSPFQKKAKMWIDGRKHWKTSLIKSAGNKKDIIWVHCSSLGEFEQGRPVIEALIEKGEKVLLTFFSPSGYENKKNFPGVIGVHYMPLDKPANARQFLHIVQPKAAIFVKYEFWFNFIGALGRNDIPIFLVSGIFRQSQHFFKPYGSWFRKHLRYFSMLFVQDENSLQLLQKAGIKNVKMAGDTRFDRVNAIAENPKSLPEIESFCKDAFSLIAGSTWREDEVLLKEVLQHRAQMKLVIAPHETDKVRLEEIERLFSERCMRLSAFEENSNARILIIDKVGLLSSVYRYASITYIGGGFGKGIHNTLEAAVYGKVVFFGPNYERFREAREMVKLGSAFPVENSKALISILEKSESENTLEDLGEKNLKFVSEHKGATQTILSELETKGILNAR